MATSALTLRSPISEQEQSIFFKLPPELRNRIYGMVFDCEIASIDVAGTFELHARSKIILRSDDEIIRSLNQSAAAPPSTALLRSCQKLHYESVGIFETSLQAYWHKDFFIVLRDWPCDWDPIFGNIRWIPNEIMGRIRRFRFVVEHNAMRMVVTFPRSAEGNWSVHFSNQSSFQDPAASAAVDKAFRDSVEFDNTSLQTSPTIGCEVFYLVNMLATAHSRSCEHCISADD